MTAQFGILWYAYFKSFRSSSMFSFTAISSRRRTRHLDAQWQLRTGLYQVGSKLKIVWRDYFCLKKHLNSFISLLVLLLSSLGTMSKYLLRLTIETNFESSTFYPCG